VGIEPATSQLHESSAINPTFNAEESEAIQLFRAVGKLSLGITIIIVIITCNNYNYTIGVIIV